MTTPVEDRIVQPVPVNIQNWAPPIKPPYVKNTTIKTFILDPTKVNGPNYVQIGDYEPNRLRIALLVVDSAIVICTDQPSASPDTSTSTAAPSSGGGYLPPNVTSTPMYEFFGPDAVWLNSLTTATRVTVIKEYC